MPIEGSNVAMPASDDHPRDDSLAPPKQPIPVFCLQCGEEFESWQMVWRAHRDESGDATDAGAWCCPTDGCSGTGFGFDILPCDEEWCDDDGKQWFYGDPADDDFDFEGIVDDAVIDQFWREDPTSLRPATVPDELAIDTEGLADHPLQRMLPPEDLPAYLGSRDDDTAY